MKEYILEIFQYLYTEPSHFLSYILFHIWFYNNLLTSPIFIELDFSYDLFLYTILQFIY